MLRVGERIGNYEILARLNAGGMATLFLGQRTGAVGFTRPVAIKVIHPHLAEDASFVQMFIEEATLSARIDHPNVVHVEELGEADGTYFLAMEYVHGCSVARLCRTLEARGERMPPAIAVALALQAADGLHAAHESTDALGRPLEVVHRDVSPHNILLSYSGHAKIIDFGIAKAANRAQQTRTGHVRGKLAYMAPEQAEGHAVDRRADIYALGVVLWELLASRRMIEGSDDLALLKRLQRREIVAPSRFAPQVERALDAVVMAALATDPAARPRTAKELRRRLVEAVPDALGFDDARLADYLREAMAEQIEADRARLPTALTDAHALACDRTLVEMPGAAAAGPIGASATAVTHVVSATDATGATAHTDATDTADRAVGAADSTPAPTATARPVRSPAARTHRVLALCVAAGLLAVGTLAWWRRPWRDAAAPRPERVVSAAPRPERVVSAAPVPPRVPAPPAVPARNTRAARGPAEIAAEPTAPSPSAPGTAAAASHLAPRRRRAAHSTGHRPDLVDGVPIMSDLGL